MRVVQGPSWLPSWTSHRILEEEIDDLQHYFLRVLKLLEAIMEDSRWQWEKLVVFMRSLRWKVPNEGAKDEVEARVRSRGLHHHRGPSNFSVLVRN